MSSENECAMCHQMKPDESTLFDEKENCYVCRMCLMDVWVEKALNTFVAKAVGKIPGAKDKMRVQFLAQASKNFDILKSGKQRKLNKDEQKTVAAFEGLKLNKPEAVEKIIPSNSKLQ